MPAPLDLTVEITKPTGETYRWGADALAGDVPTGLNVSTKRMEGYERASMTLRRRIDRDWPDIELYDDVRVIGAEGSVAYEGRVSAHPRSLDTDGHSIQVEAAGWMAHTRDRKFTEVYVDRDLGRWEGVSTQRHAALLTSNYSPVSAQVQADDGLPSLTTALTGSWDAVGKAACEAWYRPNVALGSLYYAWQKHANVSATDPFFVWQAHLSSNDVATSLNSSGNLRAAGPATGTVTASGTKKTAAFIQLYYTTLGGTDNVVYPVNWTCLAAYGAHGLTKRGTASATTAKGVYASDVVGHIVANWCPKLNTGGVQPTSYSIPHLVFLDRTDPYDALLEVNKFHLWDFAVWEDKTLHYGPADLTDWDWEFRLDDPGTTVDLQGDSAEDLANGIVVEFDNVQTGKKTVLTPVDNGDLADTSEENPVNRHGLTVWTELALSSPTTADAAVQIGRAALAEFNSAKSPGTINATGHVRDRQGNLQPGWKVRAGDTLVLSDHPSDKIRLVSETSWSDDSKQLTVAVDSTIRRLDAFLDRTATALTAAGLT